MSEQASLSQEKLKELLEYNPESGLFHHKASRKGVTGGSLAGSENSYGQIRISVMGRLYLAHRLAWLYCYGTFPPCEIDHINRTRSDNRICNLRLATRLENMQNISIPKNNTSGCIGVSKDKKSGKWASYIICKGKKINLGLFDSLDLARAARKIAKEKYHTFGFRFAE